MARHFLRMAAELPPEAIPARADIPGMLAVSVDRGPDNLCRPCVELSEEAARELSRATP